MFDVLRRNAAGNGKRIIFIFIGSQCRFHAANFVDIGGDARAVATGRNDVHVFRRVLGRFLKFQDGSLIFESRPAEINSVPMSILANTRNFVGQFLCVVFAETFVHSGIVGPPSIELLWNQFDRFFIGH